MYIMLLLPGCYQLEKPPSAWTHAWTTGRAVCCGAEGSERAGLSGVHVPVLQTDLLLITDSKAGWAFLWHSCCDGLPSGQLGREGARPPTLSRTLLLCLISGTPWPIRIAALLLSVENV